MKLLKFKNIKFILNGLDSKNSFSRFESEIINWFNYSHNRKMPEQNY